MEQTTINNKCPQRGMGHILHGKNCLTEIRRQLVLGLAVELLRGLTCLAAGDPVAPPTMEQFKRFISSPHIVENIVWRRKVPMNGGARPTDGTFARSTKFEYYQAKWQTNGFLVRQLASANDQTNLNVAGLLVAWSG